MCPNSTNASSEEIETRNSNDTSSDKFEKCHSVSFVDLKSSLKTLFWALFGHVDPMELSFNGKHDYIQTLGLIFVGAFHIAVILILVNMLIAMMSNSYEVTSANEETEWRFYRAAIWIRFIRGDYNCPPPMNIIPNVWYCLRNIYKFFCWLKTEIVICCQQPSSSNQTSSQTDEIKLSTRDKNDSQQLLNAENNVSESAEDAVRSQARELLKKYAQAHFNAYPFFSDQTNFSRFEKQEA